MTFLDPIDNGGKVDISAKLHKYLCVYVHIWFDFLSFYGVNVVNFFTPNHGLTQRFPLDIVHNCSYIFFQMLMTAIITIPGTVFLFCFLLSILCA